MKKLSLILFFCISIVGAQPLRSISVQASKLFSDFDGMSIQAGYAQLIYKKLGGEVSIGYSRLSGSFTRGDFRYHNVDLILMLNYPVMRLSNNTKSVDLLAGSVRSINISGTYTRNNTSMDVHTNKGGYSAGIGFRGFKLSEKVLFEASVQYSVSMSDLAIGVSEDVKPSGVVLNIGFRIP